MEIQDLAFGGSHCGGSSDFVGFGLVFSFEISTFFLLYLANQVIFILLTTVHNVVIFSSGFVVWL